MARKPSATPDPNREAFEAAWRAVRAQRMFTAMPAYDARLTDDATLAATKAIAVVDKGGGIVASSAHRLGIDEWLWVLAHCLLHLGFGHLGAEAPHDAAGHAAACIAVTRFQRALKLGTEPDHVPSELPTPAEAVLARDWRERGIPERYAHCGTGGTGRDIGPPGPHDWPTEFAFGVAAAATEAVDLAAGFRDPATGGRRDRTAWEKAHGWFMSSFPLLGGVAAGFTLVADAALARSWQISIAAVAPDAREIYVNPLAGLSTEEWRFVLAHEMLHAALRHGDRIGGRDPYLWNVACDYVINGWLVEMGVGHLPEGTLFDPEFIHMSAEAVYDRIVTDLRRLRKLGTLRGRGLGDVLGEPLPWHGTRGVGIDLDDFYRRALLTGYTYHQAQGRGLLPAALAEEIRVLEHPPLPWDARLARWFDEFVPSPERRRSYARPSRRQASTPDIPRPGWRFPEEATPRCTFGVVLDTSGSMDPGLLGKALGAIASYATARDVPAARVIFCDAVAYDVGYLPVAEIAGRVTVRGRGGTILQPGVDRLERAADFPSDAPILVITDGECDVIRVKREHAFLVPDKASLPFTPRGPVFRVK